jgi:hypothetical protein
MSEPSGLGGKSCGETATLLRDLAETLGGFQNLLQIAKGVCVAARAFDRPQLSCRRTSGSRPSLGHALLATRGRVALLRLFVFIATHSCVMSW